MAKIDVVCSSCSETSGLIRNEHSGSGEQLYRCKHCLKTFQLNYRYNGAKPKTYQAIVDMATVEKSSPFYGNRQPIPDGKNGLEKV